MRTDFQLMKSSKVRNKKSYMCLLMLKTWKKKKKVTTVNKRIVPIEHFEVFMIASFKNSGGHSARFRCYTDYWRDTKLPKNVQPWSITLL